MKKYYILLLLCCLFLQTSLFAQYTLRVTVKDAYENTPIPYTQIRVNCLNDVFITDVNGDLSVQINKDSCEVEFFQAMFEPVKKTYVFSSRRKEIRDAIALYPMATRLEEAKVSASKYETKPEIATTSLVVLQPRDAENRNFVSVDNLVNSAGGIVVVDNEPQIRGGSGFSSGMGSRVMIMLDDMPLLRPDAGRPMWNFIPMESIEQVEILKGAASVLFGSAALTGAINVLTAYPRSKPQTIVTTFATLYNKPRNPYQTSWLHTNPVEMGLSFLHSRIIKKNFDFVIGGEVYNDQSYIGPQERIALSRNYNSSTRGKFDQRYRINFATRYRFEKVKGLSVSLNGNFMYAKNAQSYVWFDADTNIFRTYEGSMYGFKEFTFYIDPCVKYLSTKGSAHTFRNRILFADSKELTGSLDAQAMMVFDEYQYNKTIQKIGMNIIAGASNQYSTSYGPVFSGEGDPHLVEDTKEPSSAFSNNFAMYAQLEQKFLKKRNLTIQLGGRWEFYNLWGPKIESEKKNKPIFRVGANYQVFTTKTAIRGSFGQGYRFPTIGEKFISLTVGNFGFYPNPQLRPETSWNAEIGIMQPFQVFGLRGMFDVCYFHQDYKDFIEFSMGAWGSSSNIIERFGYKFLNIGPAKVNGVDLSFIGEGRISKDIKCTFMLAYTWSNPTTKDPALIYYKYKTFPDSPETDEYSFLNTSSDTTRNVLKYRIEHMVKGDLEFAFFKKFALGGTLTYYSAMRNVDNFMFQYDANNPTLDEVWRNLIPGLGNIPFYNFYNFFEANKGGALTLDLRASCYFNKVTVSFIVKNVTNRLYALRPLYAEPPRTYTLQLIFKI
ncbi:MAG: TonB-dependent receptor [Bacteroidetes bacterium]|nr:TonB-dependent receptor [Bacteroidota bacterium]MCL2303056.1 TonB-dependent receptor [Lentimicrobiaceae bacterium]